MSTQKKVWYAPNRKEAYGDAEINAVVQCLNDGWLAGFGPYTVKFEQEVPKLFGKKYGLFVNSGSSAILLGLLGMGIKAGDEIITPACTFSTTIAPIVQIGAVPIFCDVELNRYVPSVDQICSLITEKTKCIVIPNLLGSEPLWDELRKRTNLPLFEDSADTITYNPSTDVAITSFYASHLITAGGSGGMVMFNDINFLKKATMYRDWGRIGDNSEDVASRFEFKVDDIPYDYKFLYGVVGYNMKSSEMNAAFGLVQLGRIEEIRSHRKMIFNRYLENLKDVKELSLPDDTRQHSWLAIPFMYHDRMKLLTFLENNNIQTRVCMAGNVTRHPAYRQYLQAFPNSDKIMAEAFLLGAHHGMSIEDVDYVTDKIKEFINQNK